MHGPRSFWGPKLEVNQRHEMSYKVRREEVGTGTGNLFVRRPEVFVGRKEIRRLNVILGYLVRESRPREGLRGQCD